MLSNEALAACRASVDLSPQFHDLDPMNVVWHGNYARYFEHARTALLQMIDYDIPTMMASGYAWPVVDLRVRYVRPLHYQQAVTVGARLLEWEMRLRIAYEIRDAAGQRLTKGETIQVAVDVRSEAMLFASPPILEQKLAAWWAGHGGKAGAA